MLVTELSAEKAKEFLLQPKVYSTINLPEYIDFGPILNKCSEFLANPRLSDHLHKSENHPGLKHLNLCVVENKAGRNAWRKSEIIHPLKYVQLVDVVCDPENWTVLTTKFVEFSRLSKIRCSSLPLATIQQGSGAAGKWARFHERESISLALKYKVMAETDIANCYPSIYTHAISWALHGLDNSKNQRKNYELLGNSIDTTIRSMQWNQSFGIPQGSVLMDLIAELVLGYIDELIAEALAASELSNYEILRYRDDYRIFTDTPEDAETVLRIISSKAATVGLSLNQAKTKVSNDILSAAVKEDKMAWGAFSHQTDLLQQLLFLHRFSLQFPLSNRTKQGLNEIGRGLRRGKYFLAKKNLPAISAAMQIALNSQNTFVEATAIATRLLKKFSRESRKALISDICTKFSPMVSEHLNQIWMQRLTYKYFPELSFDHPICNRVLNTRAEVWSFEIIKTKSIREEFQKIDIIDRVKLKKIPTVVSLNESSSSSFLTYLL